MSILLILKFFLIFSIYNIYQKSQSAILPSVVWGIIYALLTMNKAFTLEFLIGVGLHFIVAYVTFKLALLLKYSMWELLVLIVGLALLWYF